MKKVRLNIEPDFFIYLTIDVRRKFITFFLILRLYTCIRKYSNTQSLGLNLY